jgi:hypothetical protein
MSLSNLTEEVSNLKEEVSSLKQEVSKLRVCVNTLAEVPKELIDETKHLASVIDGYRDTFPNAKVELEVKMYMSDVLESWIMNFDATGKCVTSIERNGKLFSIGPKPYERDSQDDPGKILFYWCYSSLSEIERINVILLDRAYGLSFTGNIWKYNETEEYTLGKSGTPMCDFFTWPS